MNIVFLDCDGVLNSDSYFVSGRAISDETHDYDVDPLCVTRVLEICEKSQAKIVLSSDWKISWPGAKLRLERAGFPEGLIIDKTPDFIWFRGISYDLDCSRGAEVNEWLRQHPECNNYVILDDRTDFKNYQLPHFVHVDPYDGITDEHVNKALQILNNF